MSFINTNDPYEQVTLPYYQPPIERTDPILSQQKKAVPFTTPRAGSSQSKTMRSSQASASPRMSKAEALAVVRRCKTWLIGGSLVSFGILSALVAGHAVGTTSSTQVTPAAVNNQTTSASNAPATSSSSDGEFFQQPQQQQSQGGENGGYGFGNSNSWQAPVSRSRVS
ncbi:MAG TPA: hypothetical protein VGL94_00620 [Ktedonobacteraceae bacterium]